MHDDELYRTEADVDATRRRLGLADAEVDALYALYARAGTSFGRTGWRCGWSTRAGERPS